MSGVTATVLAAGKGTRMHSLLPKVLHKVAGKHMARHVLEAAAGAGVDRMVVVVGHQAELVRTALGPDYLYAYQEEQRGTGHAVLQARSLFPPENDTVLILCGDTPLLRSETIKRLIAEHRESQAVVTVLTAVLPDPAGYGRVIRETGGMVKKIVEAKDADAEELAVTEINTGAYCFQKQFLLAALDTIRPANAQGEYYLTDVISQARRQGLMVAGLIAEDYREVMGINSRVDLARAEQIFRERINRDLMEAGVTLLDPASTFIDAGVAIGIDTVIYPFTIIEGATVIGSGCTLGPGTTIRDAYLANGVSVMASVVLESRVGDGCTIGPYAHLRPGSVLEKGVKVGNFVELKKTTVDQGSKVSHLTYLGDTTVGCQVNVGAGTITCNYDGVHKWPTVIGDHAFIGSNTNLVAPVEVGAEAVIGAGSTITKNVPPGALGLARNRQTNILQWHSHKKKTHQNP
jgi:bifunctional UDP-N-acetylglucosamine pyrophosphorylase/glucosamine-1-phosphate N-acetyltransferase